MSTKITIEVDAKHEGIVRRALAEEMESLALSAPDGSVFDACEQAVIVKGRRFQAQALGEPLARRIDAAEKKGCRSASVNVDGKKKTAAPKPGI